MGPADPAADPWAPGAALDPADAHPQDAFHPPTSDDPSWSETCWFTFDLPERHLSGQLYPYVQPNLGVTAAGAFFWDDTGATPDSCRYAKHLWHLPIPDQPLTDIALANGIRYRCLEPQRRWAIAYDDPEGDEVHLDLTFTAVAEPHLLGEAHLDQPGRFEGRLVLHGEEIAVDAWGLRDRSWGPRPQITPTIHGSGADHGGYAYATTSADDGFHAITLDFTNGPGEVGGTVIHGSLRRDGTWSPLVSGERRVVERDADAFPVRVEVDAIDELGRELHAVGRVHNRLAVALNPNLFSMNCLTEWSYDGTTGWGQDHDNWSSAGIRRHHRERRGGR